MFVGSYTKNVFSMIFSYEDHLVTSIGGFLWLMDYVKKKDYIEHYWIFDEKQKQKEVSCGQR